MTESSFYAAITHHYVKNAFCSIVWEAKLSKTDRLPFSALALHQEYALLEATASHGFKIPDNGIGQKPYDGYVVVGALAVVIAIYYKPRATEIYEIHIRDFISEKYTSKEKSLTKERARSLGTRLYL